MNTINILLLAYIKFLEELVIYLTIALVGKNISKKLDEPINKPYRKLQVDKMPIIEVPQKLDYKILLTEYELKNGKELKPIKPRKNSSTSVPSSIICPCCNAPHIYLYDNTGGRGQYKCKVCSSTFNKKNYLSKSVVFKCPYCGKTLERIKDRNDFNVHKCKNSKCDFYISNLKSMSDEEKVLFEENPSKFKVRYIFREFNFDYKPLSKTSPTLPPVDLSRIYNPSHTLGLILTYHVNFKMSSRLTKAVMRDVHGINISHQTVLNYAEAVSTVLKPFIDGYDYELSNSFCGDETYIRVNGKWHYIFFFFDAEKKIILSNRVSKNRDTLSAVKALDDVLCKLDPIPKDLNFIVDGNPIYLLAQHYFAQEGIKFDVTQVIGLTNEDPVSREYRPLKQIIERLNGTFKGNYSYTRGFNSTEGSVSFVNLFTAYFNFLRPHSTLNNCVPVAIPEVENLPHMPARWCKLIQLAQEYIMVNQPA